jgi:hypothetical protein
MNWLNSKKGNNLKIIYYQKIWWIFGYKKMLQQKRMFYLFVYICHVDVDCGDVNVWTVEEQQHFSFYTGEICAVGHRTHVSTTNVGRGIRAPLSLIIDGCWRGRGRVSSVCSVHHKNRQSHQFLAPFSLEFVPFPFFIYGKLITLYVHVHVWSMCSAQMTTRDYLIWLIKKLYL